MQEAGGGGGGGGGGKGAPRNNTSTCRSLLTTWTICDIMNSIESCKKMLSEVCHITLTIPVTQNEHFLPCVD